VSGDRPRPDSPRPDGPRPDGLRPDGLRPEPARLLVCPSPHGGGPGRLDESARRLDHPELAVASRLAAEGHDVRSQNERPGRGPVADLVVCGVPVEIKSLLTRAERADGRAATARTLHNRLVGAAEQAPVVVVGTEGSGLRAADAAAGVRSFFERGRTGQVKAVRVIGDGFDLAWRAPVGRETGRRTPGVRSAGEGGTPVRTGRSPNSADAAARPAPHRGSARRDLSLG
jgi:hypothetical protein